MWNSLIIIVRMAALVYVGLLLVLAGCQRSMIFYPARSSEQQALSIAAVDGLAPWRDGDGMMIGWQYTRANEGAPPMLLFHGNAGFAAQRGYFAHGFSPDLQVFIMEYPGYGTRPGRPSESAFYEAALAAFAQLREEHDGPIFLGGESLGTGVATFLASQHPDEVAGLFLATPFNNLAAVARSHYPVFPIRLFLRHRFPNDEHLQNYRGPVAMLLAEADEVVPARFGQKLYDGFAGPKRLWVQDGVSHNTLNYSPVSRWWREVVDFLKQTERMMDE